MTDRRYAEKFPGLRSGTNLLTVDEAQQMVEYLLDGISKFLSAEVERLRAEIQSIGAEAVRCSDLAAEQREINDDLTRKLDAAEDLRDALKPLFNTSRTFGLGERVTKTKGASWTGRVVGFYSTKLTPSGYCVESENEPGSVQIYPESALAFADISIGAEIDE